MIFLPKIVRVAVALSLVTLSSCAPAQSAEDENAHAVTPQRIAALPQPQRAQWQAYYNRSQKHLNEEKSLLAAEVKAAKLEKPLAAPGNSGFGGFSSARKQPADWFGSPEAQTMADAAISFQTPTGGWSKGVELNQGLRKRGMHWSLEAEKWYYVGTFDNGVFNGNMTALAKIATATRNPKYAAAFNKGLDYIFDAQFPNGGWPQNYPLAGWYHDEITYNDGAMTNIVGLLRDVATRQPNYTFVDETRRAKAQAAMEAGLGCILKTQVVRNGNLTVWCAQHDPLTLEPAPARAFEVASLSGWESADVVRFLMSVEPPTPEIKKSIEGAIAWFEKVKVTGYEVVSSLNDQGGRVFTLKANPEAGPLWARFYELGTNRPLFVTREPKIYYSLAELDQSGPGKGYNWYVTQPQSLLESDYPRWKAKQQRDQALLIPQNEARLGIKDVEIQGDNARIENGANIGSWKNTDTQFSWRANLQPGTYRLTLNYALADEFAGSEIQMKVGEQTIKFAPAATGSWKNYRTVEVGQIEIKESGPRSIVVSALSQKSDFILNLREITLAR